MRIGMVRPEEAKVFDGDAGYHKFINDAGEAYGSFLIYWEDGVSLDGEEDISAGWYWRSEFPGCMPEGEANGPFASSFAAKSDALNE